MKVYRSVNKEPKIKGIEYIHFFVFMILVMITTTIMVNIFQLLGFVLEILVASMLYLLFKLYSEIDKVKIFAIFDRMVHRTFQKKFNCYYRTQKVRIR